VTAQAAASNLKRQREALETVDATGDVEMGGQVLRKCRRLLHGNWPRFFMFLIASALYVIRFAFY